MPVRDDLFAHVVNNMRNGGLQAELSEHLNECVLMSQQTGNKSTLTLTIEIKPNGSTGQYHLKDNIKTKLPELSKGASIFFGTPDGNLQRDDPNQRSLDLRVAPGETNTDIKTAETK